MDNESPDINIRSFSMSNQNKGESIMLRQSED